MEYGRDLAQVELWQASLERSRARRNQPRRRRPTPERRRAGSIRPVAGFGGISAVALLAVTLPNLWDGHTGARHQTRIAFRVSPDAAQQFSDLQPRPSADLVPHVARPVPHVSRPVSHVVRSTAVAPVVTTSTSTPTVTHTVTHSTPVTQPTPTHPKVTHRPNTSRATVAKTAVRHHPTTTHKSAPAQHSAPPATPVHHSAPPATHPHHHSAPTHAAPTSQGYANPLAHASVTPERIDQGVDYSGSGPLDALGAATITYVGTANTGWPGAFIEFRLVNGPDSGRYVYYAESVAPAPGLHVGQTVRAGQAIATITGGIEIGWGANIGTETYAAAQGQWNNGADSGNLATPSGKDFSALIASLGGPPGIVEG